MKRRWPLNNTQGLTDNVSLGAHHRIARRGCCTLLVRHDLEERTPRRAFVPAIQRVIDEKHHGNVVSVRPPELFTEDHADQPSHDRGKTSFTRMTLPF